MKILKHSILTTIASLVTTQAATTLESDNPQWFDSYGIAVATSGDRMVVGDPGAEVVFVYTRSGADWVLETKLTGPSASDDFDFGSAVAISGDNILVGAHNANAQNGKSSHGLAYVFNHSSAGWGQPQVLMASNAGEGDHFGWDVKISGDQLLVSAYKNWDTIGDTTDEVYLFANDNGVWSEITSIPAQAKGAFGKSLATSDTFFAIGAMYDNNKALDNSTAYSSGSVYIYGAGKQWKLTEPDPIDYNNFGTSIAFSGSSIAIGTIGTSLRPGKVYVFTLDMTTSEWVQEAILMPADSAKDDGFGSALAFSGEKMIVGRSINTAGEVSVFERTGTDWKETGLLFAPDSTVRDRFGYTVALEGNTAIVGASGIDKSYVFDLTADVITGVERGNQSTGLGTVRLSDTRFLIPLSLNGHKDVSIDLFNAKGSLERNFLHGTLAKGEYNFTVDLNDLATGNYVLRARVGNEISTQKIELK